MKTIFTIFSVFFIAICLGSFPSHVNATNTCPRTSSEWIRLTNNVSVTFPTAPVAFSGNLCPELSIGGSGGSQWCCNVELARQVQQKRLADIRSLVVANLTTVSNKLKNWVTYYNVTADNPLDLIYSFIGDFEPSYPAQAVIIKAALNSLKADILTQVTAHAVLESIVNGKLIAKRVSEFYSNLTRIVSTFNTTGSCKAQLTRAVCDACTLNSVNLCANACGGILRGCVGKLVRRLFTFLNNTAAVYDKVAKFSVNTKDNFKTEFAVYLTAATARLKNWNPPAEFSYSKLQVTAALALFSLYMVESVNSFVDNQVALLQDHADLAKATINHAITAFENVYQSTCNNIHAVELTNSNCWTGNTTVTTYTLTETDPTLVSSSFSDSNDGLSVSAAAELGSLFQSISISSSEADSLTNGNSGNSLHSISYLGVVVSVLVSLIIFNL